MVTDNREAGPAASEILILKIFLWMGLSAGVVGLALLIFADLGWMVARLSTKYGIASDPG